MPIQSDSLPRHDELRWSHPTVLRLLALCLLPSLLNLLGFDFGVRDPQAGMLVHTILETLAFSLAGVIALLAALDYRVTRDASTLVIGCAFFFSGSMDFFHITIADHFLLRPLDFPDFVPWTGSLSRFGALLLKISACWLMIRDPGSSIDAGIRARTRLVLAAGIALGTITVGIIYLSARTANIPTSVYASGLIHRPWDLPGLVVCLLAGSVVYPAFFRRYPNRTSYALLLSVIPDIFVQLHMVFGAAHVNDNHYIIAHGLKILSHMVLLGGLAMQYFTETYLARRLHQAVGLLDEKDRTLLATTGQLQIEKSEHRTTEILTLEKERYFRALIENNTDIITVTNGLGKIEYSSPSIKRVLGYDPQDLVGKIVFSMMHPADLPGALKEFLKGVRHPGTVTSARYRFRHRDGSWRYLESTGQLSINGKGEKRAIINSCDVTERMAAEERLRLLERALESASDGITLCDASAADLPLIYVNAAFERMTGYTRAEVMGKNPRILQRDDRNQPGLEAIRKAIREGKNTAVTLRNYKKDGTMFWNEVRINPVFGSRGAITHWVGIKTDITNRKAAEARIQSGEERVRLLLDSTAEGIYGIDLQGRCVFANAAATKELGYPGPEALIDKVMHDLIHDRRPDGQPYPVAECPSYHVLQTGVESHALQETFWRADGTSFTAEYWCHPMVQDGKIIGAVVTFLDITQRKKLENQLLQSGKLSAVGQLASGVAHEINNPLGVILGFAQALLHRISPENEITLPLKSIEREALRCKDMVQGLLVFSRASNAAQEAMDLNAEIKAALSLVRAQARLGNVQMKQGLDQSLPPILGNRNQIQQIIVNLANNALDAMGNEGTLTVQTQTVREGNQEWISLKVSDTGTGIPPAIMTRIFEPFFTTKPVGQGTGLGLGLVHEIVEKHRGFIEVHSRPGLTEFEVKFPVFKADLSPAKQAA